MQLPKISMIVFASVILSACSSDIRLAQSDEALPGFLTVRSTNLLHVGSAIQWNEQYAVTAAHIPQLANIEYYCSTGCDLVFIRRDSNGFVPKWRSSKAGEPVTAAGVNSLMMTVKSKGINTGKKVRLITRGDHGVYALSNAPVADGMSGGPVYGPDNAVIGMIVGIFSPQPLSNETPTLNSMSTYVPFEVISHEWSLFSRKITTSALTPQRKNQK